MINECMIFLDRLRCLLGTILNSLLQLLVDRVQVAHRIRQPFGEGQVLLPDVLAGGKLADITYVFLTPRLTTTILSQYS